MSSTILIAYFSRAGNNYVNGKITNLPVGNTEVAAKKISDMTYSVLFKINPVKKYSADYNTCTEEAKDELSAGARPELAENLDNIDGCDKVILCYPIWWGTMPMPVWTFLEKYDFSGKTILPLCTHEGSGLGSSEADIQRLCPNANVKKGLAIRGGNVKDADNIISDWLQKSLWPNNERSKSI